MSFQNPLLLVALAAVPAAIALWWLAARRRMRYTVRFTNVDVLAAVTRGREWRRWVAPAAFLLALATLCVAVARPHVHTLVSSDRATVVLVLDVSGSMGANDVKPTRLIAAEKAVHLFLDNVPKRVKVGLVLFAAEAEVATPPTTDHTLVGQAVDDAGQFQGLGGTAIGDAIATAVRVGLASVGIAQPGGNALQAQRSLASVTKPSQGLVSILFLSDGRQNRGLLQPLAGAARARVAGIPIYTIALGLNGGTQLTLPGNLNGGAPQIITPNSPFSGGGSFRRALRPDPATLKAIANATGGQFFRARDASAVESAYSRLGSSLGRQPGTVEVTGDFLGGAALLLVLAGIVSALWGRRIP
jgi:Ca-activated chloride channel homolog